MKLMTTIVVPCFVVTVICMLPHGIGTRPSQKDKKPPVEKQLQFEKDVLPALVKNCSPCHFPDGKMYERLPFDKESTIIDNGDNILKRIGDDEKKAVIKQFILQHNKADGKAGKS